MQKPELIADLTFLPMAQGGRRSPTPTEVYGCVCQLAAGENWDCRVLVGSEAIGPGDSRRVGMIFLSGKLAADRVRTAGGFTLWDGRVIAFGRVVE